MPPSPPKAASRRQPQQERSLAIVDAIVVATCELLGDEGPSATTNRIAERAGVSVGSLYRYFPSKDALFDAAAERYAARLLQVVGALDFREPRRPLPEAAREIVRALIAVEEEFPGLGSAINRMRFNGRPFPVMDAMEHDGERIVVDALAAIWPQGGRPVQLVATVAIRAFVATVRVTLAYRPREIAKPAFVDEIMALMGGYMERVDEAAERSGETEAPSGGVREET